MLPPINSSKASCTELGWKNYFGSKSICANARLNSVRMKNGVHLSCLSKGVSYLNASKICFNFKSRLPTIEEVLNDATFYTGCYGQTKNTIWTSTLCYQPNTNQTGVVKILKRKRGINHGVVANLF